MIGDGSEVPKEIVETFLNQQLIQIGSKLPCYVDVGRKFLHDVSFYLWDDPLLFRRCANLKTRQCIPKVEEENILVQCHASPYEEHFRAKRTYMKVLQSGFYGPTLLKDCYVFAKWCDTCQRTNNIFRRDEMSLNGILE